jgi:hypothetical protein
MNEDELFHGYRNTAPDVKPVTRTFTLGRLRFRPCDCGSWLGFDHSKPAECQRLVETHQLTARHQAWATEVNYRLALQGELL